MFAKPSFKAALRPVEIARPAIAFQRPSYRSLLQTRHFLGTAFTSCRTSGGIQSSHMYKSRVLTTALGQRNIAWSSPLRKEFSPSYNEPKDPLASSNWKEYTSEDIEKALSDPSKSEIILIDVREPHEVESSGLIPTANCLPANTQLSGLFLDADEFRERYGFEKPAVDDEEGEKDIVFYCKSGTRARNAARAAALAGYDEERIGVYPGSWLDWSSKGGKAMKWQRNQQ